MSNTYDRFAPNSRMTLLSAACAAAVLSIAMIAVIIATSIGTERSVDRSSVPVALAQEEQPTFFVNTTDDLEIEAEHCTVADDGTVAPCPLRAALERAGVTGGAVRARWCPAADEGEPCLGLDDPNFVVDSGKWRFPLIEPFAHVITGTGTVVDFAADVPDWGGPADNRVLIDTDGEQQEWVLAVEASDFQLRGFDLSGVVEVAALTVRLNANNGRIEGLAIYDVVGGAAYHFRDAETVDNVLVGSWCGVKGDGTTPGPIDGPCVRIETGASRIQVGERAGGPNFFCNATDGVHVRTIEARANHITGNYIGVDPAGGTCANGHGVRVSEQAPETTIASNTIASNTQHGVLVADFTFHTLIESNRIGLLDDGSPGPNGGYGVRITNLVKGTKILSNTIAHNAQGGVRISGGGALQNNLSANLIHDHGGYEAAVVIDGGSNGGVDAPVLSGGDEHLVNGRACPRCIVEFFSDPLGEARNFEGRLTAANNGIFRFEMPNGVTHGHLTATATDPEAGTSPLARPLTLRGDPLATATPVGHLPNMTNAAFLPWLARAATR